MMHALKNLRHGTFERCVGTETIPGCSCKPCERAYRARLTARKSFGYYRVALKVPMYGRKK